MQLRATTSASQDSRAAAERKAKPAMGASNSRPVTSKFTDGEENDIVKYAASSMQGWRTKMEDARAAILDLDGSTSFFGVYDGHGGAEVALYCARQFHTELVKEAGYHNNLANAIERVFFRIDEQLQQSDEWRELANPGGNGNWIQGLKTGVCANLWPSTEATPYIGPQNEGSTACVVLIRHNQIIVANVGDSRCVLSRNGQAIDLSTDHKPNLQPERHRIQRAGGHVLDDGFSVFQVPGRRVVRQRWRVYCVQGYRVQQIGMLDLSRAIGDFAFKQNKALPPAEQMVTCNPDIRTVDITDDTEFLVIASDGIWDCMSSQKVVDFVRQELQSGETNLRDICEGLLDRSLPSTDNTTAILVQFKAGAGFPPPSNTEAEVDLTANANSDAEVVPTANARADNNAEVDGQQHNPDDENQPLLAAFVEEYLS